MRSIKTFLLTLVLGFIPLFLSAQDIVVFPQIGHTSLVNVIALSPNERLLLSTDSRGILLCNMENGRVLRSFWGHDNYISALTFSPSNTAFVSGDRAGTIKIWNLENGQETQTLSGHAEEITSLAYSPDGRRIVSASSDGTMTVWDAGTGAELHLLFGDDGGVLQAAYSPDGKYIVSASAGNLIVWDAGTGKKTRTLSEGKKFWSAAYSPNGRNIVSVTDGGTLTVWDAETGRALRTIQTDKEGHSAVYSQDNRNIISWAFRHVRLWNADTGQQIKKLERGGGVFLDGNPDGRRSLAYGSAGNYIISGEFKAIDIINTVDGEVVRSLNGQADFVKGVWFSPDNRQILVETRNAYNVIWDVQTGQLLNAGNYMLSFAVSWRAYSADGRKTVYVDGFNRKVIVTTKGRKESDEFEIEYPRYFTTAALSPDGSYVVAGSTGDYQNIKIWDIRGGGNGKIVRSFSRDNTFGVIYSPDGKRIVSGHKNSIKIWDAETGREQRTLRGHTNNVMAFAFSPDGKRFISGSFDTTIRIWDIESGRELLCIADNIGLVSSVAYSPDGRRIAAASRDGSVYLYDTSGKRIAQFVVLNGRDSGIVASATRDIAVVEIAEKAASVDGEWIAITPDGYYQASPQGDRYLNVRVGNTVSGIDSYRSVFYNPEVVQARLAGRPDPASKATVTIQEAVSFGPPTVTVHAANSTTTTGTVTISVTVSDKNQPIKNIKVLVNGALLGRDDLSKASGARGLTAGKTSLTVTGNLKEVSFTLPVPLEPGENTIEVTAFNGYTDNRRSTTVTWQTSQRLPPPNLWILAIGVNKYDDSRIRSLNYCVSDAQGIIGSFKAQEGKRYAKVNSLLIADGAAVTPTTANIRDRLKWLDQAGPRDVIVLFLAGHGITSGNKFYFVPKDGALKTADSIDTAKAISDTDILSVLDAPGKRLIFIDACQSGGVDGNLMTRTLMESNGLVFTASQGNERSSEFEDIRHGIFTYSIMQGLNGRYNARTERNIRILPLSVSVSDFVSKEVERRTGNTSDPRTQHPRVYSLGFPELTIAVTE